MRKVVDTAYSLLYQNTGSVSYRQKLIALSLFALMLSFPFVMAALD